uniref:Uncharacterized protein n=1 Tax=Cacopsylla melanoneura TaxID=428564 RepID=A0A8D8V906_9HEMI
MQISQKLSVSVLCKCPSNKNPLLTDRKFKTIDQFELLTFFPLEIYQTEIEPRVWFRGSTVFCLLIFLSQGAGNLFGPRSDRESTKLADTPPQKEEGKILGSVFIF